MAVDILRQSDSPVESYRLVAAAGRQYTIRIRPVRDHNGRLFGYRPTIEPVQPIIGSLERAERAALHAIERICRPENPEPSPAPDRGGDDASAG